MKSFRRRIRRLWRRFLDAPKRVVNWRRRVRIETLEGWDWCDRDRVLLHAAFQILVDFVDKERPFEVTDYEHDEYHRKIGYEIQDLYFWWTVVRPARVDPLDAIDCEKLSPMFTPDPDSGGFIFGIPEERRTVKDREWYKALDESRDLDDVWNKEDEDNLIRLCRLRRKLWT